MAFAALLLGTSQASPAADLGVSCGQTITVDTVLQADLSCATGGLTVQAGVLDLNGHVLSGQGSGAGIVLAGADTAVVHGTVRRFGTGISVASRPRTVVRDVLIADNVGFGAYYPSGSSGAVIDASSIVGNGDDGVYAFDLVGITVQGSQISRNGGSGIDAALQADRGVYRDNQITRNARYGIYGWLSSAQMIHNTITRNGLDGIQFRDSIRGIQLFQDNIVTRNGGVGIAACIYGFGSDCGPGMIDGGGNHAYRNTLDPQCINIVCSGPGRDDPADDD